MQSQQEHTRQLRISSAHTRRQPSSSSLTAPDSSQSIQAHYTQQQHEAQPTLQRQSSQRQDGSSAVAASQLTKLDGVIYHFYTTTANLITQFRLAHLRPFLATLSFDSGLSDQNASTSVSASSQPKLSRWFGLHIPDSDLFKEELRLWRSITTLLGLDSHQFDPARPFATIASVPELIIDVLLDLSSVSDRHEVLLLTTPPTTDSFRPSQDNTNRVCLDGRMPGDGAASSPAPRPQRIVLERWRLRFDSNPPSTLPDLSTSYKRSVVHFRALFTLLCALPSNSLCAKIEALKTSPVSRSNPQPTRNPFPTLAARQDMGSHDRDMAIGCRISVSSDGVPNDGDQPYSREIGVTQPLPAEQGLNFPDQARATSAAQSDSQCHYATRTLPPIETPIGHLELSVAYRKLTSFSVENAQSLESANNIQMDLDEDYFKAKPGQDPVHEQSKQLDTLMPPPQTTSLHNVSSNHSADADAEQRSGTVSSSAPAPQRIGGISAARPSTLTAQRSSLDSTTLPNVASSTAAGAEASMSQSPANASVFSTSSSGRNTAGLSSLRRTASNKGNVPILGPVHPSATPSSPALAAALSTEAAFVVPSSVRRPSHTERRLRSLSGLSSGRPSPPVSPITATSDLPDSGAGVPRSASAAFCTSASRSISTRTTSGFAGSVAAGGVAGSSQPRSGISFSPSSSSPLAQQMSLQGSRPGTSSGLAPSGSYSAASLRSASGSNLRSSTTGAGMLATPSLRSVFQSYVPRSQNTTSLSMSRTPPTSNSTFVHGGYSPSNLGTGLRSSIRRNSSTSDAGSGSAFGASLTPSSAAKPQMIKRYSTNFAYRQNRERSGLYGSSLGSEASSFGAGAEPSSYPRFGGTAASLGSAQGRSWVSRMEQRQGLGTGGAFARTSSLENATAAASASVASRYRPTSGTGAAPVGGLSPSPRSHDEEIDDLVRLLETRPAFGSSSIGKLAMLRNDGRRAPGLSSTPEEGGGAEHGLGSETLTDSVHSNVGPERTSSLSGSGLRGGGIRTANPMSRSQLDDLLSRMAESVGLVGSKERGSSASAETSSDVATSEETRNTAGFVAQQASAAGSVSGMPSQSLSRARITATLGKGRGDPAVESATNAEASSTRIAGTHVFGAAVANHVGMQSRGAIGHQVRAYGTSVAQAASSGDAARTRRDQAASAEVPAAISISHMGVNVGPDYEAEGDLMFTVDGQPDYAAEDELAGEMEMVPDEPRISSTDASYGRSAEHGLGGGIEGGMGATLPVGAHREGRTLERVRSGPMGEWHASERWERERAQEAERRRADAEMSRNFGQGVGAIIRGRDSHSPWRSTSHTTSAVSTTAATPMSVQPTSTATGGLGFRSSSTRPLTGANRLIGAGSGNMGGAYGSANTMGLGFGQGTDGRRGYGVSAPSTQFHYQPHQTSDKAGPVSSPVSRDETYEGDD